MLIDEPAPRPRWAIALLGIALAGCGTKPDVDGADTVADGSSSGSSSTSTDQDDAVTTVNSAGCMTYAGPSCGGDWSTSEDGQGSSDTGGEDDTTTTAPSSESETGASGSSDTGSSDTGSSDTGSSSDASSSDGPPR